MRSSSRTNWMFCLGRMAQWDELENWKFFHTALGCHLNSGNWILKWILKWVLIKACTYHPTISDVKFDSRFRLITGWKHPNVASNPMLCYLNSFFCPNGFALVERNAEIRQKKTNFGFLELFEWVCELFALFLIPRGNF